MGILLKRYKVGLIAVFGVLMTLLLPLTTYAQVPIPGPSSEYYVYDGANILDSEVEQMIINTNLNYERSEYQPQVVVATVESLGDYTIEEFATDLFEHWQIGNDTYDNGVLLLISDMEREIRIEVGYGLEGALPDSATGRIIDNNIEYLSNGDYSSAVDGIFTDIVLTVNNEYELDNMGALGHNSPVATISNDISESDTSSGSGGFSLLSLLIPGSLIALVGYKFKSSKKREDEVRAKLEAKYPNREFTKEDIRGFIRREDEKKEQDKYRVMATEELTREVGAGNFTKQMLIQRMQKIRRNEERDRRRRNNRTGHHSTRRTTGRSGGRRSSGGGGRSGGGGASRNF